MCQYIISQHEIINDFDKFLQRMSSKYEGDVVADTIAKAWNILAKKYQWEDKLTAREVKMGTLKSAGLEVEEDAIK